MTGESNAALAYGDMTRACSNLPATPTVSQAAAIAAGPSPKPITTRVAYGTGMILIGQNSTQHVILFHRLTLLDLSKHSPHCKESEV